MTHNDPQLEGALGALQSLKAARGDHDGASDAQAELARLRKAQAAPAAQPRPTRQRMAPTCGAAADAYWGRVQRERQDAKRKAQATKPTGSPHANAITPQAKHRQAVEATRRATVERGGIYASATATGPRTGRDLIDAGNAALNQALILRAMADRLDAKGTDDASKDATRLNRQAAQQFQRTDRRATPAEVEEARGWFDRFGHHLPDGRPVREASA